MDYLLRLNLTALIGSRVVEIETVDGGTTERGVFIPIESGGLETSPNSKHITVKGFVNSANPDYASYSSHYITQKINKQTLKKLQELGYKTPFIGSLTPNRNRQGQILKSNKRPTGRVKIEEE